MNQIPWLVLGLLLGGGFIVFARSRRRSERDVFALGLLVAAAIYVGFAFEAGSTWLLIETIGIAFYGTLAWLGRRRSPLWLAGGWRLHPVWDTGLHLVEAGAAFTPRWYGFACISFDLLVAGYIAIRFRPQLIEATSR